MLGAALLGMEASRLLGFDTPPARALLFSAGTRNSLVVLPLALAVQEHSPLVAAVVVIQTLVELAGELVDIRIVPR